MLKETSKSLRLYFGFVAAISFFYAAAVVAQGDLSPLVAVFSVVNLVFGVMFTYIVVKFRVLLYSRPAFIKKVLVANLMFSVVGFALSIPEGLQLGPIVSLIVAVLIYLYLVKSVIRLSSEEGPKTA